MAKLEILQADYNTLSRTVVLLEGGWKKAINWLFINFLSRFINQIFIFAKVLDEFLGLFLKKAWHRKLLTPSCYSIKEYSGLWKGIEN